MSSDRSVTEFLHDVQQGGVGEPQRQLLERYLGRLPHCVPSRGKDRSRPVIEIEHSCMPKNWRYAAPSSLPRRVEATSVSPQIAAPVAQRVDSVFATLHRGEDHEDERPTANAFENLGDDLPLIDS
jgi:hypothetical protein